MAAICLGLNMLTDIMALISNHIYGVMWDVITHPCPNLNGNGLTHWGRDKMAAIFQTTFLDAFSWMKMY